MSYRVLAYYHSGNLGDTIQTYAMARLLPPPLGGVYRLDANLSVDPARTFVVNGWLSDPTPDDPNCLLAGVYVGSRFQDQLAWARRSRFRVGARGPHTQKFFAENGIASEMIGCATLTFPRYEGPRAGVYCIDAAMNPGPGMQAVTNHIDLHLDWATQWKLAAERLALLRTAELVYTYRLHIALPCLAFGTPVFVRSAAVAKIFQRERFSLMDVLGFRYDKPFTMDVTPFARRFMAFLAEELKIEVTPRDNPPMPTTPTKLPTPPP